MPFRYTTGRWVNRHNNVSIEPMRKYDVWSSQSCAAGMPAIAEGCAAYQAVLRQAARNGAKVRPYGGAWSLSGVATTTDYMINTGYTPCVRVGLGAYESEAAYRDELVFAQCGASVAQLHAELWPRGLCLPTSGASNGQTIAGALATGTHGSAHQFGAMQEMVVGIHLVLPDDNIWLERSWEPITTAAFRDGLGARLVADNGLFNAALVAFGSLGFLHAFVLRAVPRYKLRLVHTTRPWNDVKLALSQMAFGAIGLLDDPWHVEAIVDPYSGNAHLRWMEKVPDATPSTPAGAGGLRPAADALNLVATLDGLGAAQPHLVDLAMRAQLPSVPEVIGQPAEIFGPTSLAGRGISTELGVRPGDLAHVIDQAIRIAQQWRFLGGYAIRFVRETQAHLGFTMFPPVTATIETPMLDNTAARRGLSDLYGFMYGSQIPHTFHWGQDLPLVRPRQVLASYEGVRLGQWLNARWALLPTSRLRRMFSNSVTDALGLS